MMKNLEFSQLHYEQMLVIDEDHKDLSFEELKQRMERGAEIVAKNRGFANLDTTLEEQQMVNVGAFIDFRLAKRDLGEYVEEIDD